MAPRSYRGRQYKKSNLSHSYTPSSPVLLSPRISKTSSISRKNTTDNESTLKPPRSPRPLLWHCHRCRTRYNLGATRRCLLDSHVLCFPRPPAYEGQEQRRSCQVDFDYDRWIPYNAWRREVSSSATDEQESEEEETEKKVKEFKDCWTDCDWPGECLRAAYDNFEPTPPATPKLSPVDPPQIDEDFSTGDVKIDPLDIAEEE